MVEKWVEPFTHVWKYREKACAKSCIGIKSAELEREDLRQQSFKCLKLHLNLETILKKPLWYDTTGINVKKLNTNKKLHAFRNLILEANQNTELTLKPHFIACER